MKCIRQKFNVLQKFYDRQLNIPCHWIGESFCPIQVIRGRCTVLYTMRRCRKKSSTRTGGFQGCAYLDIRINKMMFICSINSISLGSRSAPLWALFLPKWALFKRSRFGHFFFAQLGQKKSGGVNPILENSSVYLIQPF